MTEKDYVSQLFTDWCECSPYGEQVPDDWPDLMASFVKAHAGKDADQMEELIAEADQDDPFERLLESIFRVSCAFVLSDLSNAVNANNVEKLQLIGLPPLAHNSPADVPSEGRGELLPFDLAKALTGAKVVTRNLWEVTEIHIGTCPMYCVVGFINGERRTWTEDGQHVNGRTHSLDLFMLPTEGSGA